MDPPPSLSQAPKGPASAEKLPTRTRALCLRFARTRYPFPVSLRRDIDVAGVPVQAHHIPELITRLRRRGYPSVAHKVERALSSRTVHVAFNAAEREVIARAVRDRPPRFSELHDVLIGEIKRRRANGQ